MILIVSLNLFVHKTAIVDGLEVNTTNTIQDHRMVVGESAIYSALVIKTLQGEPYVLGIAGGIGGRYIKNFMDKNRIKSDLLWKDSETKSELKIIDSINMTETIFIDDTFFYDENDGKHLRHKFQNNIKDINTIIINDKSHDDMSYNIVKDISELSHQQNMRIIASFSGNELRKAMELCPYAAVVNEKDLSEFGVIVGEDEKSLIIELRKILSQYKLKYLVYDNNRSIYTITKYKVCGAKYGKFANDLEEIASKDVIVGALAISVTRKYEMEKMTKLMAAVKGSINLSNYPKICNRKDIDELYNKIKLIEYVY